MLPAPEGQWAMPKEIMQKLPGYDPDIAKSRAEAQKIMQTLDYGGQTLPGQDLGPQFGDLPRSRGDPRRSAQEHLDRRRARSRRNRELAAQAGARRLCHGAKPRRQRPRRPRPEFLRELY